MIFKLHTPIDPLNLFIENIIYYNGYESNHKFERLLPDGSINIVINLSDRPRNVYNNENMQLENTFKRGLVSGIRKDFISKDADTGVTMMVVAFKPGGAYPFFDFPLSEITGKIIELDEIWGNSFIQLRDHLLVSNSPEDCFIVLENYLIKYLRGRSSLNPFIKYAVDAIKSYPAVFGVKRLTEKIGYSQKHFIDIFKKEIGVSPKLYMRLTRFQKIIKLLEEQKEINWSDLALSTGFYDQAHFTNEFKRFCGMSPTEYLSSRGEIPNYLPFD